ncbi:hypothetical protein [Kitasatospora sp. NPDC088346]|uniref:hypothetical protein n=1 Tax=Kitasatospora sp. NPDC088346 TaxID=3364073 RepID=UPI0038173091
MRPSARRTPARRTARTRTTPVRTTARRSDADTRWTAVAVLAAGLALGTAAIADTGLLTPSQPAAGTSRTTAANPIGPTWNSTGS